LLRSTYLTALAMMLGPIATRAAERYVFDVFGQEKGLTNSSVTRIALDHQGALWVGTENGLFRYDGHRFLPFTTSDGLPGNKITAIHESPDGTLWVGTLDGLAWREGAGFRKASNDTLKSYVSLQGIASDRTGRVFVATRKGVAVISPSARGKDSEVTFLPWPGAVPRHSSSFVYSVSPNELWFACDVAICLWDGKDVRVWNEDKGVPRESWDSFLKDRAGNLWARSREFFVELPAGADRFETIGPDVPGPVSFPSQLAMDYQGRILVATSRGVVVRETGGWRRVTERQGLPENTVTAFLADPEGSIWLGTFGAGLVRWAGYDAWSSFTENEGLAGSSIASLLEDPPRGIWVGTTSGLSHGVLSNGSWNWAEIPIPGVSLAARLARSKDGALWMITDGRYVVRYDPVSRTSRRLGPFADGPFHLRVDGAGRLWISETGSVLVGDPAARLEDFERIHPPGSSARTVFTATAEDADGNLWLGSMSGLFLRSRGNWSRFNGRNSDLRSLRITDLTLSPQGELCVSYSEPKGADCVRLSGESLHVDHFDRSNGLTSDQVNSVAFDRLGRMWILNDHGAEVRNGDSWTQFSRADGMFASTSNGGTFLADVDGAIWIGSERGLSRYLPAEGAQTHDEPMRVRFSEIRLGNALLNPDLATFVESTPQGFQAKFSALLLAHGQDLQYRYRFAGLDDQWRETAEPEARLDYPPPGQYQLEVQAHLNSQPWSEAAALTLQVRPHWYQTRWFRGTLGALAVGLVWMLERFRRKKVALKRILDQRTAELRESEERFRSMADNAPVMIWLSGPDRFFLFFNRAWLNFTGTALGSDFSRDWLGSVHPDDRESCTASYSSASAANQSLEMEFRRRRSDGEYRWVLCKGVPRFTAAGEFAGYIGSEVDITDVKRAEQEVVSKQKLESLSALTGGIAHDFNNLLGAILADAELAGSDLERGVSPLEEVHRIQTVALRASEIVRELMVYSGQDQPDLEQVELSQLVAEMLELLKASISKHAVLKTKLATNLPRILANAAQIRQVVMNLIINASEAIDARDGIIDISTSRVGETANESGNGTSPAADSVRLAISDTGAGMTEEVKARIFEPFFSNKFAGRGLGLAVVDGIVRAHGGWVQVDSAPGVGTTFEVFFPSQRPEAETQSAQAPQLAGPVPLTQGTVLLVEDEGMLRLAVGKMLRKQGFSVMEAADGIAAIDLFNSQPDRIDVILLDMTIGGCSSREVLVEATRLRPEIKVVLMSAYSREMANGFFDSPQIRAFLRKPFLLSELAHVLRNV
jgi:PAS domain S-box-containing protein